MDFYASNAKPIAAIGIILIFMMTYCIAYLRRKFSERAKYTNIINKSGKSKTTNRRLERAGDSENGYSPLRQKNSNPSRNMKKSDKSARSGGKTPFSHTNLGNFYIERRNYSKAVWHYKQALQLDRHFDPAHVGIGNIEYNHGKIFSAMRYYTFATNINRKNLDALVGLGNCFQQIRNYEKALECYEQAYKIDTRHKDLNAELSNLYIAKKEYRKANDILTRSITLYPCSSRFYKSIGDMYSILNKEKMAVDAYIDFLNLRCDKVKLTNLVRSSFERYLALEIISDLIKGKRKINYDSFIREMSRMMTIFLIRQRILGELNNAKKKAYQNFSSYFINKVMLSIAQGKEPQLQETAGCN